MNRKKIEIQIVTLPIEFIAGGSRIFVCVCINIRESCALTHDFRFSIFIVTQLLLYVRSFFVLLNPLFVSLNSLSFFLSSLWYYVCRLAEVPAAETKMYLKQTNFRNPSEICSCMRRNTCSCGQRKKR